MSEGTDEPTTEPIVDRTVPESVLEPIQVYGDTRATQQAAADAAELEAVRTAYIENQKALTASYEDKLRAAEAQVRMFDSAFWRRESSQAFGHRIGVNIHSTFQKSVYRSSNYEAVIARLKEVGVSWVRDNLGGPAQWTKQYAFWQRLVEEGIMVHPVVGGFNDDLGMRNYYSMVLNQAKDLLVRVEGWNEPDKWTDWMDRTVDHQIWLGQLAAGLEVDVVGPSLHARNVSYSADVATLYERISGSYDLVNLHCYPGGGKPAAWYLDQQLAILQPFGKVIITEGGYNTGIGVTGYGMPVPEDQQATLTADYVQQARIRGLDIALYELLDDPDASNVDWEAHFGLYRCPGLTPDTWTPKPVVAALANLPR
jgi:hypothetical protein